MISRSSNQSFGTVSTAISGSNLNISTTKAIQVHRTASYRQMLNQYAIRTTESAPLKNRFRDKTVTQETANKVVDDETFMKQID